MKSYNLGPIKVDPSRRNEVSFDEISFGVEQMSITDEKVYGYPRVSELLNIVQKREGNDVREFYKFNGVLEGRQMIRLRVLQLSNEGSTHRRVALNIITQIADLGGLYAFIMLFFTSLYYFFASPLRNLHLAVSFNSMKNQICR